MAFQLSSKAKGMAGAMKTGDAIELPFPVAYFWAVNGQPQNAKLGGTEYFGGWGSKDENIDDVVQKYGKNIPETWKLEEVTPRDGKPYAGYSTRELIIAPVSLRNRWVDSSGSGKWSPHYKEGYRNHLQVLAVLGAISGGKVEYQYPCVLTGKGFQATYILNAIKDFEKHIDAERRKVCPDVPAQFFWRKLGTFGDKPNFQTVGKNATSKTTPITVTLPEKINLDILFVGEALTEKMSDIYADAGEWLGAWKQPQRNGAAEESDELPMGDIGMNEPPAELEVF